jgi:hypothetical protein
MGGYELDSSYSGQGAMAGSFEHGNEISASIKCGEFDWLNDSAPYQPNSCQQLKVKR